jgi:superfamily I DNA and/or RNA helicase
LYSVIERNVIRSDRMFDDITGTDRLVLGSRVILCTISMLSNDRVMNSGLIRLTPVQTVIVDEASQIEIGDYLPMVDRFQDTLKKIACIGDDKQCGC